MTKVRRKKASTSRPVLAPDGAPGWLTVVGARHNNLKNLTVDIPLGRFVCITGVSGSGKSSLVNDILRERLARDLNGSEKVHPGQHDQILGIDQLDKIVDIDQSPIGRTPRSNPATYIKVFDEIRLLFSKLPDAKVRGYKPGRFSFNVPTGPKGGGRCDACEGNGANKVEMDFLADIWVTCPVCGGRRFNRETRQILYKARSIADVLDLDVTEALDHFSAIPKIADKLRTLHDVGLDYLKLGQSSTTLSGGEAQRVKLARELVKKPTGRTIYLLDEPTTGLHFDDIKKLLAVLHEFVDAGNSVVVIEHNLDVVKTADWVIDLGPEGGEHGGKIVVAGTPEDVAGEEASYTGQSLRQLLGLPRSAKQNGRARLSRRRDGRSVAGAFDQITVVGAKQHNLKDIDVAIPRGKTSIFAGPSGSGKSSLAIDTIYAEGQRRYVESLSSYARQFLGQLQKPRVDHVHGLSPAIAIEQKSAGKSPRSTVGTVTEIYDYMRVLWSRIGQPFCPKCGASIGTMVTDDIVDRILKLGEGTRALLLAPVERSGSETYAQLFGRERANGFSRVRVDGRVYELDGPVPADERRRHSVELVVERLVIRRRQRARITDSVEQALAIGQGDIRLSLVDSKGSRTETGSRNAPTRTAKNDRPQCAANQPAEQRFSQRHSCERCGESYDELTPHHFSFNTRMGWCDRCEGLGVQLGANPDEIAIHPTRSILDGALAGWDAPRNNPPAAATLRSLAEHIGFDPEAPWRSLEERHRQAVLQGCGDSWIELRTGSKRGMKLWQGVRFRWRGFFPAIDRATRSSWQYRKRLEDLVTEVACEHCGGSRLRPESRCVRVCDRTIEEVCWMPLTEAAAFFAHLRLSRNEKKIAGELLHEVSCRLRFLLDVGLDYLTLHRPAPSLSGGESQRIRLASQIGSGLTGVLYVLDEPTIGLHPRDNARLIAALSKLRDLGNTLIIVEHDRDVIDHADRVFDFGPGAGSEGGEVVATGTPKRLRTMRASLTGKYLAGRKNIPIPSNRRDVVDVDDERTPDEWLVVRGARHHNLKEIDVAFPLGRFVAVTGVSGSGKSSLVSDTLYNALASRIHRARLQAGAHDAIDGAEHVSKVINVDQSPIGNSPSSNPATYSGAFDCIRELYAKLPDSKVRGYTANRFSFNRPGGRCEACDGNGQQCIEMHFLPDVWIECENCRGTRYLSDTLEIHYRGKSIADVLAMRVTDACRHFDAVPKIRRILQMLDDVGLGYVALGQPAPTLSGGEAQRVKLAAELARPSGGRTLYILDEPTTGLHFDDLRKLLDVLHRLVDLGNTVVCIEHNLDVVKTADHVIDIGPEAAESGGTIVVAGTPEEVAGCTDSHTGIALKPVLSAGLYVERIRHDLEEERTAQRELRGAVSLDQTSEVETKMPWQIDGKRWHTVNHRDRRGKPVRWDPKALEWFVGAVERIDGFAAADWNDRARVEIKAPGARNLWFVHILTGGRDLLEISVRVPARHFDNKSVVRRLKIKTLDERTDLPIYGQWARVRLRASGREHDDIRIHLRDFKDINKTAFKSFLADAADTYLHMVRQLHEDPVHGQPWKTNGRKWHLSQQSIHVKHEVKWDSALLLKLIGRISKIAPEFEFDWNGKVAVGIRLNGQKQSVGKIVTNMGAGLRCELRVPNGAVTPVQIERLGVSPDILPRQNFDLVSFWVAHSSDIDIATLAVILESARPATTEKTAT